MTLAGADAAATAASTVKWHFDSDPPGASITIDGKPQPALTPGWVTLPRGERPVEVVLAREGFVSRKFRFAPLGDHSFAETLMARTAATEVVEVAPPLEKPRVGRVRPKTGIKPAEPTKSDDGKTSKGDEDWMPLPGAEEGQGGP